VWVFAVLWKQKLGGAAQGSIRKGLVCACQRRDEILAKELVDFEENVWVQTN
jgi:hypothetical protein